MKERFFQLLLTMTLVTFAADYSNKSLAPFAADCRNKHSATLVLKNGVVYTMDKKNAISSAIAIVNDRIRYVGTDCGARHYIGKDTKVIDLAGKMILPGFIDSHIHACQEQDIKLFQVYLVDVEQTIESYQAAVKNYGEKNPNARAIIGFGYQLGVFGDAGPAKGMLDVIIQDKPVALIDISHHAYWVNSKALELANITRETIPPQGGTIVKDEYGEPTGYLIDCGDLLKNIFDAAQITPEQYKIAFTQFEKECTEKGITAISSFQTDLPNVVIWETMADFIKNNEMTLRTNFAYYMSPGDDANMVVQAMRDGQKYGSDYLKISTVKMLGDGIIEGKTAYLLEPYAPEAGMPPDYRGNPLWQNDELKKAVTAIDKAGFSIQIHTIADGSSRQALDAFEYAFQQNGIRDARHSMVHVTYIDKADIPRMSQLGVIAAMQPIWCYKDPIFSSLERQMLGPERFSQMYALKDMLDAGIVMTGSADNPVTPDYRPLAGIETGVTQGCPYPDCQNNEEYIRNAAQALSVMDMVRMYTINGAKQMHMEKEIGSIEVNKKADLVVLAQDITKISPQDISETEVVHTIFNGKVIFSK
ncbi:MAG: amidohydrolase [Chitinivibrionales bacterium]|nr:amidohydrolase [Chitinivibrionales bacterium]